MHKNPTLHPRDTKLALPHPRRDSRDPIGGAVLGLSFAPDVVSGWLLAIEKVLTKQKPGLLPDSFGSCMTSLPFDSTT